MIVKIPIYIEIQTKEDFDPSILKLAVDKFVPEFVNNKILEYGGFPHTTEDFADTLGTKVAKAAGVKRLSLTLIKKSEVFRRINNHD